MHAVPGMPSRADRTTPELMELMARLESMLPYWQAPKVLADSCPLNRLRRMRSCARYDQDRQAARRPGHAGNWRARSQTDDRWHLEMQLPGARRKSSSPASIRRTFVALINIRREFSSSSWPDAPAGTGRKGRLLFLNRQHRPSGNPRSCSSPSLGSRNIAALGM